MKQTTAYSTESTVQAEKRDETGFGTMRELSVEEFEAVAGGYSQDGGFLGSGGGRATGA
jgi:hypothetical protein